MKKTILIVLMVVFVATPCLAQEIKPDGLFTIDNTQWQSSQQSSVNFMVGFADGIVYGCDGFCFPIEDSSYLNLFVLSFFELTNPTRDDSTAAGVLFPIIGIGFARVCGPFDPPCVFALMQKMSDTFNPDM